jgi:hypothetical protein
MTLNTDQDKNRPHAPLTDDELANRDPITGAPGAHPVGVGVGALGGAATGAAVGSLAGPVGTVVGGGVGAVVGGLAGKAVAEGIDPTVEDAFWRDSFNRRPYVTHGAKYDDYQPAYRYGWETASKNPAKSFDDIEDEMEGGWATTRGDSSLTWNEAKLATRDAWERAKARVS